MNDRTLRVVLNDLARGADTSRLRELGLEIVELLDPERSRTGNVLRDVIGDVTEDVTAIAVRTAPHLKNAIRRSVLVAIRACAEKHRTSIRIKAIRARFFGPRTAVREADRFVADVLGDLRKESTDG